MMAGKPIHEEGREIDSVDRYNLKYQARGKTMAEKHKFRKTIGSNFKDDVGRCLSFLSVT
jgi:hypothetical protein